MLSNFDYLVDGLVRQLQQPGRYPTAAPLLASLFQRAPMAPELLPALAEPATCALQNLSILARHRHPQHTRAFLMTVVPIVAAAAAEGNALVSASAGLAHTVAQRLAHQQAAFCASVHALADPSSSAKEANAAEFFQEYHSEDPHASIPDRRDRANQVELSAAEQDTLHRRHARVVASSELASAAATAAAPLLLAEDLPVAVAAHDLVKVCLAVVCA